MKHFVIAGVAMLVFLLGGMKGAFAARYDVQQCINERISGLIAGTHSPDEYVAIRTYSLRILGRGWKYVLKKRHAEVNPEVVLKEMDSVIRVALREIATKYRKDFKGATVKIVGTPKNTRRTQYLARAVLTVPDGQFAGRHNLRAIIYFTQSGNCRIQMLQITILGTDIISILNWLNAKDEVQALLKKYGLN